MKTKRKPRPATTTLALSAVVAPTGVVSKFRGVTIDIKPAPAARKTLLDLYREVRAIEHTPEWTEARYLQILEEAKPLAKDGEDLEFLVHRAKPGWQSIVTSQ